MSVRILIADDHESALRTFRKLLETEPGWKICGEAVNGKEAVTKARELRPGIIILDLVMPQMDGLEAAREITKLLPAVPIVLHTLYPSSQIDVEAKKNGIQRVVGKADRGALVSVVREL